MPLTGIRVVDLTRIVSGPFCTMLLGDMGADVVKIEKPGEGDPVRRQGACRDGFSWYFAGHNRNKRSLSLDLYSEEGKEVLRRLIAHSDVLVENFRPGTLEKMGFGKAALEALNPDLIVCGINGFGGTGPYVDRPAFDFIAQAMSGFMSVNGPPDGGPMRVAPPLSDVLAGLYAAFGVVCALHHRQNGGGGQYVEAAMVNSLMSVLSFVAAQALETGRMPEKTGNDHPVVAPYGVFQAADGSIAVAPSHDRIYARFIDAIGLGELKDDERFNTNDKRFSRRPEIKALIQEKIAARSVADWVETLNKAGVPCSGIPDLVDVFEDPQTRAQEMVIEVDHPGHGMIKEIGFPVRFDRTPCRVRRPAPELGQHTEEVLREIGYADADIAHLRKSNIT